MSRCTSVLSLAFGLSAFATVSAAETFDLEIVGTSIDKSVVYPVGEGHLVVMNMADYTNIETRDPSNPLNGATGPCFGEVELKNGAPEGDGYCTWTDTAGDNILINWTATGTNAEGNNLGDWQLLGGTGRWQGATGGGTYRIVSEEGSDKRINQAIGTITLE